MNDTARQVRVCRDIPGALVERRSRRARFYSRQYPFSLRHMPVGITIQTAVEVIDDGKNTASRHISAANLSSFENTDKYWRRSQSA
jgi:hypothetical protein